MIHKRTKRSVLSVYNTLYTHDLNTLQWKNKLNTRDQMLMRYCRKTMPASHEVSLQLLLYYYISKIMSANVPYIAVVLWSKKPTATVQVKGVIPPAKATSISGDPFFTLRTRSGFRFLTPSMCGVWGSVVCKTMYTAVSFLGGPESHSRDTSIGLMSSWGCTCLLNYSLDSSPDSSSLWIPWIPLRIPRILRILSPDSLDSWANLTGQISQ